MEQISLEDKVNNTLKWLANQIASIQVYHWDEEFKKESFNDAWQKVQKQFKKDSSFIISAIVLLDCLENVLHQSVD